MRKVESTTGSKRHILVMSLVVVCGLVVCSRAAGRSNSASTKKSSRKFRRKWDFVLTAKFIMRLLETVYVPLTVVTVIFKVLIPCKLELILS
jgi:cell division protein FtsW (lipid II flippase)